jgi:hypothetical protein
MFVPSVNKQDSMKVVKVEDLIGNKNAVGKQFACSFNLNGLRVFRLKSVVEDSKTLTSVVPIHTENNGVKKLAKEDLIVLEV